MTTEDNKVQKTGTEELTAAVQNLNINDAPADGAPKKARKPRQRKKKTPATEGGDVAATQQGEVEEGEIQQSAPLVHDNTAKVFVGNLSFDTTKEELEQLFGQAGKIENVNLITRGDRSLGYGFISFASDSDADKAVSQLDKTDVAGRQINVERAADKEPSQARGRGARGGANVRGRGGRGYSGARGRVGRAGALHATGSEDGGARVDEEEHVAQDDAAATRGRGARGRGARAPRAPRAPRENSGETSETTLFVANLPFKVTDEDLKSIFKDYQVTSAHVVVLRSGRSKGFGFVEVASEEEQQKVLNELKNVEVDGRELVIKVAMKHQTPPSAEERAAADAEQQ
ncbi:hypothetical protein HKX48_002386 [Thoreauomyces humboldtii]|nr:hypothetical protein HKX48_002386 [Thoreauomyces humboldtii]